METTTENRLDRPFQTKCGKIQYLAHMGDLSHIAHRARESTGTSEVEYSYERDVKTVQFLASEKHDPPFEHGVISFRVYDIPLFTLVQILRYRTFSFSVDSSRYRERESVSFYRPQSSVIGVKREKSTGRDISEENENAHEILQIFERSERQAIENLRDLRALGCPRELYSRVAPQTMLTSASLTVTLRNLFYFLDDRLSLKAQYEIRCIAAAIYEMLLCVFPDIMAIKMPKDAHMEQLLEGLEVF